MNLLNKVPDTFILSKLLQKDSTYIFTRLYFRISRIRVQRFSQPFFPQIIHSYNDYSLVSSKLFVSPRGNNCVDELRLSKPVFHRTVPTYRSRYNCSEANIRD